MTRIDIVMCTFRRPQVAEAIAAIANLHPVPADLRLVVADNDDTDSARATVEAAARGLPFPCLYLHAPARNISVARNACLEAAADADWIASLDDDETVAPDWLAQILKAAEASGADGALGTVRAIYPEDAPAWLRELDLHSTHPARTKRPIANSGNVLLRWKGMPWQGQRYDLSRGQTGGEDTEFFLRLTRMGAQIVPAPLAVVTEPVPPARQTLEWLAVRRYRMGQTHIVTARSAPERASLLIRAAAKAGYCRLRQALASGETRRNFWYLRGQLHRGVCAGLFDRSQPQLYGRDPV